MEIFRISRDVYGREVLQGMSWDLLWVFFGLGAAFIVCHMLYRLLLAPRRPPKPAPAGPGGEAAHHD